MIFSGQRRGRWRPQYGVQWLVVRCSWLLWLVACHCKRLRLLTHVLFVAAAAACYTLKCAIWFRGDYYYACAYHNVIIFWHMASICVEAGGAYLGIMNKVPTSYIASSMYGISDWPLLFNGCTPFFTVSCLLLSRKSLAYSTVCKAWNFEIL